MYIYINIYIYKERTVYRLSKLYIYMYMYWQNVCIYVYSIYAYYESTQHSRHTNFTLPRSDPAKGTMATSYIFWSLRT